MADYYSILKKTIASLPESNGAARRSVYSRARNAIVNQLKAYEPPLSPSEITAEQLRLEEAIRKVEAEAARESLGLGAPVPPPAPIVSQSAPREPVSQPATVSTDSSPEPAPNETAPVETPAAYRSAPEVKTDASVASPLQETLSEAQALGTAATKAVQNVKDVAEPPAGENDLARTDSGRETDLPASGTQDDELFAGTQQPELTAVRPDEVAEGSSGAAVEATPYSERSRNKRSRKRASEALQPKEDKGRLMPLLLAAVLTVSVLGTGAYFFLSGEAENGSGEPSGASVAEAPSSTEPVSAVESQAEVQSSPEEPAKNSDRLLNNEASEEAVAPDARTVTTTTINPEPVDQGADNKPSIVTNVESTPAIVNPQPVPSTGASTDTAVAPVVPENSLAAVTPEDSTAAASPTVQKSILYEEGADAGGAGTAAQGAVVWNTNEETGLDGKAQSVLSASVEIPERDLKVDIRIKPNDDTSLPASHLVEIKYELPEGFSSGDIVNVPGLVMKPTEEARGDALIGASVKVSPGYFWIALSSLPNEQQRNLALLRERGWIDIPMLYENGKRGILTLEKGNIGSDAVEKAIAAWQAG